MDEDRFAVKFLRTIISSFIGLLACLVLFSISLVGMMSIPFLPEMLVISNVSLPQIVIIIPYLTLFFPIQISGSISLFMLIGIGVSLVMGGALTGFLAVTVKKAIVSSTIIAILLGLLSILTFNLIYSIVFITCIIVGGCIGGYVASNED
ncbi:MAG: hypothetical protein ACTSRW_06330 [Candidatus Helarchaeota archaeon]